MAGYSCSNKYDSYEADKKDPYGPYDKNDNNQDSNEGKLFVGGLAWDSTEESIKKYFERFGLVSNINLKRNKEDASKHRGFAFVKFVNAEDADAVLQQTEPHVIDGSRVDPKSACPQGVKPEERTKKIFVGGLQAETTEEKLREYFTTNYGEIKNNIEFAVDHNTKKRRGFCFIEFASEAIVDRIVKERYHEIAGKRLETKRALSKHQQESAVAAFGVGGLRRPRIPGSVVIGGYGGVPVATSPYAQPVIYIHPDSLSTSYPLSAVGNVAAYSSINQSYTSALETLYTPYSRDSRHGAASRGAQYGSKTRHDPYRR